MENWEKMALRDQILQMVTLFVNASKAAQIGKTETNPSKLAKAQEEWEKLSGQALRAREELWRKIDEL